MMKVYEKPVILESNDLSEGVFTASGYISDAVPEATAGTGEVPTPETGGASAGSYTLNQTNAWDGFKQYDLSVTNNTDQDMTEISVIVGCEGTVTQIVGNVTGVVNGDGTATLTFNNYGNGIAAYGTYNNIYLQVAGQGEFCLR